MKHILEFQGQTCRIVAPVPVPPCPSCNGSRCSPSSVSRRMMSVCSHGGQGLALAALTLPVVTCRQGEEASRDGGGCFSTVLVSPVPPPASPSCPVPHLLPPLQGLGSSSSWASSPTNPLWVSLGDTTFQGRCSALLEWSPAKSPDCTLVDIHR